MPQDAVLEGPAPAATTTLALERLLGLEIQVVVCLGRREIMLCDLATLGVGSVVELDRGASAPVELLVNHQVVANGDLLVVEDRYVLRVTEIVNRSDPRPAMNRARRDAEPC